MATRPDSWWHCWCNLFLLFVSSCFSVNFLQPLSKTRALQFEGVERKGLLKLLGVSDW